MNDQLVLLIRSMSKSEKKHFRIVASFGFDASQKQYVHLFDHIEHYGYLDETKLLKKYSNIKKSQISNLKSHLFKQVLLSLRNNQRKEYTELIIHELLDSALILNDRGLTKPSLKILKKAKTLSSFVQNPMYQYLIFDYERKVKGYETREPASSYSSNETFISEKLISNVSTINKCQNLSNFFHSMYMRNGFIKNENEYNYVNTFFKSNLPNFDWSSSGTYEKMYYIQCHVWFYYMVQDFLNYFKFSSKWIQLFDENINLKSQEQLEYISGLHNTLNALFLAGKIQKFDQLYTLYIKAGEAFQSTNSKKIIDSFQYYRFLHFTNQIMLHANYKDGVQELERHLPEIEVCIQYWSDNRKLVMWYKIACVFFGSEKYEQSITYLNEVIKTPVTEVREDIHCFARILNLICHFELGNSMHLGYQIKSVYRFLYRMRDLHIVQKEIIKFLRRTPYMNKVDFNAELMHLRGKISEYAEMPYLKRPFLYLDILAWIDSKVSGISIQTIIRSKIKQKVYEKV